MEPTTEQLIPSSMLYRFSVDCLHFDGKWQKLAGVQLDERYTIPVFSTLDNRRVFAEMRIGWNDAGLFINLAVTGKTQSPWCRPTQLLESDSLQLWIDTRDTHNVHRASRFCHWFVFLPTGGGTRRDEPMASMLKINRARDVPKSFGQATFSMNAKQTSNGYTLSIHIPAGAMDGWNAQDHRKLGFHYAVVDRELGVQSLAIGAEFPTSEDPSLWQTLELVDR